MDQAMVNSDVLEKRQSLAGRQKRPKDLILIPELEAIQERLMIERQEQG